MNVTPMVFDQSVDPTINLGLVLSLFALIISAGVLFLQYRQAKALKWHQADLTFHYLEIWGAAYITEVRSKVRQLPEYENYFSEWKHSPIKLDDFKKNPEYKDLQHNVITILNFLDMLCLAYLKNAVDQEIIYQYFGQILVHHYKIFKPFIQDIRSQLDIGKDPKLATYIHIEIVAKQWSDKMNDEYKNKLNHLNKKPYYKIW